MGHPEGNFTPVLYIGRKVPKDKWLIREIFALNLTAVTENSLNLKGANRTFTLVLRL